MPDLDGDLCSGVPPDHRLRPLFSRTGSASSRRGTGEHVETLRDFGHKFCGGASMRDKASPAEIDFALKLAEPKAQGGVVVALLRPPPRLEYTSNFDKDKDKCATLKYLDEVLRVVAGSDLSQTSCFDASPFDLVPIRKSGRYSPVRSGHDVFQDMIDQKEPDVVFCAWQGMNEMGDSPYASEGVGAVNRTGTITTEDHTIKLVNGFPPSYAINYYPNESCLRQLFMLEMAKAFGEARNDWVEKSWMRELREICKQRVEKLSGALRPLYDRCLNSLDEALSQLEELFTDTEVGQPLREEGNRELYDRILKDQIPRRCCDALLALSICVDANRNRRPTKKAKEFAVLVRKRCFKFIFHCAGEIEEEDRPNGSHGYLEMDTIKNLVEERNTYKAKQPILRILDFLHRLLVDLNAAFRSKGSAGWNYDTRDLEKIFETLAIGIEKTLAQMLRDLKAKEYPTSPFEEGWVVSHGGDITDWAEKDPIDSAQEDSVNSLAEQLLSLRLLRIGPAAPRDGGSSSKDLRCHNCGHLACTGRQSSAQQALGRSPLCIHIG